jgi:hypothetical protein
VHRTAQPRIRHQTTAAFELSALEIFLVAIEFIDIALAGVSAGCVVFLPGPLLRFAIGLAR